MKISCITISNNTIQSNEQNNILNYIFDTISKKGLSINSFHSVSNTLDSLSRVFNSLDEELLFVVGGNSGSFNFDIKNNLCNIINESIMSFDLLETNIQNYINTNNVSNDDILKESYCPNNSFPLICEHHYLSGFLYRNDSCIVVYLPENLYVVKELFKKYIDDIIIDLFSITNDSIIISLFGITNVDIESSISDLINNNKVKFQIKSNALESTIIITNKHHIDNNIFQEYVAETLSRLKKYTYSTSYDNIYKVATNMLYLSRRSLFITETFTKGCFTKMLLSSNDYKNLPIETHVYSNIRSLLSKYKLNESSYENNKLNVKLISELSSKIYETNKCDLLLCLLGEYDDKSYHNTGFISITDEDGIHIYKNSVMASEEDMIEVISKSASFYLIKKIKENNLLF